VSRSDRILSGKDIRAELARKAAVKAPKARKPAPLPFPEPTPVVDLSEED
jgi:hypothetical protein